MTRVIRIDDDVYENLKKLADPFEDTPNSVIRKLLHSSHPTIGVGKVPNKPSGKIKRGDLTPQSVYEEWLIHTLWDEFKGRAKKGEVTEATISNMERAALLKAADYEKVSSGETKAVNTIAWARNRLKDMGLMSSDSPYGNWELTEEGIEKAKRLQLQKLGQHTISTMPPKTSIPVSSVIPMGPDIRWQLKRSYAIGIEKAGSNKFKVEKGAIALDVQGSLSRGYLQRRQKIESEGLFRKTPKGYELLSDYEFDSKAQATNILLGVSESANRAWKKIS